MASLWVYRLTKTPPPENKTGNTHTHTPNWPVKNGPAGEKKRNKFCDYGKGIASTGLTAKHLDGFLQDQVRLKTYCK